MFRLLLPLISLAWVLAVSVIVLPIMMLCHLIAGLFTLKGIHTDKQYMGEIDSLLALDLHTAIQGYQNALNDLVNLPSNSRKNKKSESENEVLSSGQELCAYIAKVDPLCGKKLRPAFDEMRQIENTVRKKISEGTKPNEVFSERFNDLVKKCKSHLVSRSLDRNFNSRL